MAADLIFSTDVPLDRATASSVEARLRRQLAGLLLDRNALGTFFDVRGRDIPGSGIRVVLRGAPTTGVLVGPTISVAVTCTSAADFVREVEGRPMLAIGAQRSPIDASKITPAPLDVPEVLLRYASSITVAQPYDEARYAEAVHRFDSLVGIPKHDLLNEVTSRLKGAGWLSDWSRRHYGRLIPAAMDAGRSAPLILLCGDPGTGKSVVARHIPVLAAHHLRHPVIDIQLSERLRGSGIQGRAGSELVSAVDAIGRLSTQTQMPAIVFLDEAESVAGARGAADGSSGAQENVAVVDALITGIDRVFGRSDGRLVFMMATNLSGRIDPAIRRRATAYQFARPTDEQRRSILEQSLGEIVDARALDDLNDLLYRPDLELTAADVLHQVIARAVRESAQDDRSIDVERIFVLAKQAVPTPAVANI